MQVFFSITSLPPLVHPAVKWVHSMFKARVDKTTDCGDYNILPVVAQVGLRVPTPLISGAVSSPASTRPGYSICSALALVPEVAPRGSGFSRGAWPFIGQLPNLSILCACVFVRAYMRMCVRACMCV